jgi:hypothetical protein
MLFLESPASLSRLYYFNHRLSTMNNDLHNATPVASYADEAYYDFREQIEQAMKQGGSAIDQLQQFIACDECKPQVATDQDAMLECPACNKLYLMHRLLWDAYIELHLLRKHRRPAPSRAYDPLEAYENGLQYWFSRDVLDCGHRGLVDIDSGKCLTCENHDQTSENAKPVKLVTPVVAPPTPEQIAERERLERERKKEQNRERQKRYKANKKKLAEITKKAQH